MVYMIDLTLMILCLLDNRGSFNRRSLKNDSFRKWEIWAYERQREAEDKVLPSCPYMSRAVDLAVVHCLAIP